MGLSRWGTVGWVPGWGEPGAAGSRQSVSLGPVTLGCLSDTQGGVGLVLWGDRAPEGEHRVGRGRGREPGLHLPPDGQAPSPACSRAVVCLGRHLWARPDPCWHAVCGARGPRELTWVPSGGGTWVSLSVRAPHPPGSSGSNGRGALVLRAVGLRAGLEPREAGDPPGAPRPRSITSSQGGGEVKILLK